MAGPEGAISVRDCVIEGSRRLSGRSPGRVTTELGEYLGKVTRVGIALGERQPHLAYRDAQSRSDFQQLQADRRALRPGEPGAFKSEST